MIKEGREDYIYLGHFDKKGYLANRFEIHANGKTGQENFDNNLWKLKMQVERYENSQINNSSNQGKHYVISDIHGKYGSYCDVIKKLSKNDYLYILGDVIDRGDGGVQIIQDIMKRQQNPDQNPKITFLLGNHELMLMQTVAIMQKYQLHKDDLITIMNNERVIKQIGSISLAILDAKRNNDIKSIKAYIKKLSKMREYEKTREEAYNKVVSIKGIDNNEMSIINNWLNHNGGDSTIFDYLATKEQREIYEFLINSYVVFPEKIQNKNLLFVHSVPPKDNNKILQMKNANKGYRAKDLTISEMKYMLEKRDDDAYWQSKNAGFLTICGHTPEIGKIESNKEKGYLRIDAGCGHGKGVNKGKTKLALYCIEDDKVEYIDEKEEPTQTNIDK